MKKALTLFILGILTFCMFIAPVDAAKKDDKKTLIGTCIYEVMHEDTKFSFKTSMYEITGERDSMGYKDPNDKDEKLLSREVNFTDFKPDNKDKKLLRKKTSSNTFDIVYKKLYIEANMTEKKDIKCPTVYLSYKKKSSNEYFIDINEYTGLKFGKTVIDKKFKVNLSESDRKKDATLSADEKKSKERKEEEEKKERNRAKIKAMIDAWAKFAKGDLDGTTYEKCEQIIGKNTREIINILFLLVRIATPVILVLLTMLDFAKAVAVANDKSIPEALQKFVKRAIIAIIIFLLPTIINLLLAIGGMAKCGIF